MKSTRMSPASRISYSDSAATLGEKVIIRLVENSTGRLKLIRRARRYEKDVASGRDFFEVMLERYGLPPAVVAGSLDSVPRDGPLIVLANHPYGILDGLVLGHLLAQTRGEFRLLANSIFGNAQDLSGRILPISFDDTKQARDVNILTRRTALDFLSAGGAIGIFPGGTVSTAVRPWSKPMDPVWRKFTARLILKSRAAVLPVYFEGNASRVFQIASHMHTTLRMGLLINEFGKRVDSPVRIAIREPVPHDILADLSKDTKALMDFLRKATYDLSPDPVKSFDLGYEFDERHRH